MAHYDTVAQLDKTLKELVAQGAIKSRAHMIELLGASGYKVTRQNESGISIVLPNQKRPNRMRGGIYDGRFTDIDKLSELGESESKRIRKYVDRDTQEECRYNRERINENIRRRDQRNKKRYKEATLGDRLRNEADQRNDLNEMKPAIIQRLLSGMTAIILVIGLIVSDLTSLLKPNELFVDIGYYGKNYYIFSVDKIGEVKFEKLNDKDSDTVNTTIKEFRADIDKIINATDANSSKALKELYSIVIEKGIGDRMDKFNSLIISTDGALRLLPFEALMDGDKYLIESKQIRYTPSAKEFIRTHKFNIKDEGKDITMFSDPNYESKSGKIMEMVADTPNVNKAVQTRSIKNMGTFKRLRGFKKEEEVLQSSFSGVKLFSRENANEENILAVKSPKILHITTHGYFISDENITNPMLKSGVALSGANIGIKQQTGEGLVNALKLSGLSLDGTDLVVLSACETGLVDVKDTSSVASLPKTFIQAGSKNVLMSLWSVDDNSTVELMKEFYTDTKGNEKKFNEVLRNVKIKMIKEGKHPFYWAAFIMSGE